MTQEEKQLLLKDLCARLPYGVKVLNTAEGLNEISVLDSIFLGKEIFVGLHARENIMTGLISVKPYLRPMSSMTKKENEELKYEIELELQALEGEEGHNTVSAAPAAFEVDFYNKHHFDYRGLTEKGLALEAPADMYKTEQI